MDTKAELRRVMAFYGVTTKEAGEILGKSPQTILAWRSRKNERKINLEQLYKLKAVLSDRYINGIQQ